MPGIPERTQPTRQSRRWIFGRRWLGGLALALAAALLPGGEALAYRFFEQTDNDSLIPVAATAVRWSADVWGPSDSLPWVVADSPGWTEPWVDFDEEAQDPPFANREEALPFIEQALDAWSDIPSARISWRMAGLGPELYRERDRTNAVRVHAGDTFGSYAALFIVAGEMVECDVNLSPRHVGNFASFGMNVLIHEFGHCLGLGHSGVFPTWDSTWRRRSFETALWRQDPKMSYGGTTTTNSPTTTPSGRP